MEYINYRDVQIRKVYKLLEYYLLPSSLPTTSLSPSLSPSQLPPPITSLPPSYSIYLPPCSLPPPSSLLPPPSSLLPPPPSVLPPPSPNTKFHLLSLLSSTSPHPATIIPVTMITKNDAICLFSECMPLYCRYYNIFLNANRSLKVP